MKHADLISNLDYLREENRLLEYVDQFYFFLQQAVQHQDVATLERLLTHYLREVFYTDNRERLQGFIQQMEAFIFEPHYKQYQPIFYLVKGNLHYFSINFKQANEQYKKAISIATEVENFYVLAIACNNMLASKEDMTSEELFHMTTMPAIFHGMGEQHDKVRQYMLLLVHIEAAILSGNYTYAQNILHILHENLVSSGLTKRELLQLKMMQLRIFVENKQYASFFELLASFSEDWAFQYDLQTATYQYAMMAAKGLEDDVLYVQYEKCLQDATAAAKTANAQIYEQTQEQLMTYMVPFETLKKKAERHINRNHLPSYCVIMFHVERQTLTDDEVASVQATIHEMLLPLKKEWLFSCTIVSEQKMLYVFKTTKAQLTDFFRASIQPRIQQIRDALQKEFHVIISCVQNDLHGYKTFEQTLQHSYALLYYAKYNGEGALLNA